MTKNISAVDFNGVKVVLDTNTALITLKGSSGATPLTMIDLRDNSKYQVPTGKKATIIFITNAVGAHEIIYADDEDGTTNSVTLFNPTSTINDFIFISNEVPAEKYINITAGGTFGYEVTIIEESAT